jgi:hypothetical protein
VPSTESTADEKQPVRDLAHCSLRRALTPALPAGLQAYYAQAEQIEELKRSATFPKLTPPSPDFLGMMEEYVEQAPRGTTTAGVSDPRFGGK